MNTNILHRKITKTHKKVKKIENFANPPTPTSLVLDTAKGSIYLEKWRMRIHLSAI